MYFQNHLTFSDLASDFKITVDIYDLVTERDNVPNRKKDRYATLRLTPKSKRGKSPAIQSPAGPKAVMPTNFKLLGTFTVDLLNYKRKNFSLAPGGKVFANNCPLDGTLHMKISLQVSLKLIKIFAFKITNFSFLGTTQFHGEWISSLVRWIARLLESLLVCPKRILSGLLEVSGGWSKATSNFENWSSWVCQSLNRTCSLWCLRPQEHYDDYYGKTRGYNCSWQRSKCARNSRAKLQNNEDHKVIIG